MNKIEICKKIKETIRRITVISDNSVFSLGAGVVINSAGLLLTANHVVRDYPTLIKPKIVVGGIKDIPQIEYKPLLYNVSVNINMPDYINPLTIDLAILEPISKINTTFFVELDDTIAIEGEEVIMAGFPDDIKLPLGFDKKLNFNNPELGNKKNEIENMIKSYMRLIMIRSGMIGSVQGINIISNVDIQGFKKAINVNGAEYWIDNTVTYGASGGSVLNSSGKLIGIICEKGATKGMCDPEMVVPSGSAMALSHKLITWFLEK